MLTTIKSSLGPIQKAAIQAIQDWDFSAIGKKTKSELAEKGINVSDEYIAEGLEALKRYHIMAVLDPLNLHAVSERLDPFWHTQILFTTSYFGFCEKVLGAYMHHVPLDHDDKVKVGWVRKLYEYTSDVYLTIFGKEDRMFFPREVADYQLMCIHHDCKGIVRTEALFPLNSPLAEASMVFA